MSGGPHPGSPRIRDVYSRHEPGHPGEEYTVTTRQLLDS